MKLLKNKKMIGVLILLMGTLICGGCGDDDKDSFTEPDSINITKAEANTHTGKVMLDWEFEGAELNGEAHNDPEESEYDEVVYLIKIYKEDVLIETKSVKNPSIPYYFAFDGMEVGDEYEIKMQATHEEIDGHIDSNTKTLEVYHLPGIDFSYPGAGNWSRNEIPLRWKLSDGGDPLSSTYSELEYELYIYDEDNKEGPQDEDEDGRIDDAWLTTEKEGGKAKAKYLIPYSALEDMDYLYISCIYKLDLRKANVSLEPGSYYFYMRARLKDSTTYGEFNSSVSSARPNITEQIWPLPPQPNVTLETVSEHHEKIKLTWSFTDQERSWRNPADTEYTNEDSDYYIPEYNVYVFSKAYADSNTLLDEEGVLEGIERVSYNYVFKTTITAASIVDDYNNETGLLGADDEMDFVEIILSNEDGIESGDYYVYVEGKQKDIDSDSSYGKLSEEDFYTLSQDIVGLPPKPRLLTPSSIPDYEYGESEKAEKIIIEWNFNDSDNPTDVQYDDAWDSATYRNSSDNKYIPYYQVLIYGENTASPVDSDGYLKTDDDAGKYDDDAGEYISEANGVSDWEEIIRMKGKVVAKYKVTAEELDDGERDNCAQFTIPDEVAVLYNLAKDAGVLSSKFSKEFHIYIRAFNKDGVSGKVSGYIPVEITEDMTINPNSTMNTVKPTLTLMKLSTDGSNRVYSSGSDVYDDNTGKIPLKWYLEEEGDVLSETNMADIGSYEILIYNQKLVDNLGEPKDTSDYVKTTDDWDASIEHGYPDNITDKSPFKIITVTNDELIYDDPDGVLYHADLTKDMLHPNIFQQGVYDFYFYVRAREIASSANTTDGKLSDKAAATVRRDVPYPPILMDPDAKTDDGDDTDGGGRNDDYDDDRQGIDDLDTVYLNAGLLPLTWIIPSAYTLEADGSKTLIGNCHFGVGISDDDMKEEMGHGLELLETYTYYEVLISKDESLLAGTTDADEPPLDAYYYRAYFTTDTDKVGNQDVINSDNEVEMYSVLSITTGDSSDPETRWSEASMPFGMLSFKETGTYFFWVRAISGETIEDGVNGYWSKPKKAEVTQSTNDGIVLLEGGWRDA